MPLTPPVLDDRTFEDIVREARTLIPRYTKEWTDFNDSDPGMALIQLFAWMTEQVIFRLNQVPELNYVKFLQLLGVELAPAQPAKTDLTFTADPALRASNLVPALTRVAAPGSPPLVFETDQDLWAVGALLDRVLVFDSFSFADRTAANGAVPPGPPRPYSAFGPHARTGSYLALGFLAPAGFPAPGQAIDLMVYASTPATSEVGRDCAVDLSPIPLPAQTVWEYFDGSAWWPLVLDTDDTRALTRSGGVRFWLPSTNPIGAAPLGPVTDSRFWVRNRLLTSTYERAPALEQVLTNTVPATQAETIRDEILGGGTGEPNQVLRLANAPVLVLAAPRTVTGADGRSIQVISAQVDVDEGAGPLAWQEVSDFVRSGPTDPHFTIDRTTGEVTFGDGRRGRIPLPNQAIPNTSIVARAYRTGGGSGGNAAAGAIQGMQGAVPGIQRVTNVRPAQGGADEETVDDAKLRAPRELKSKERAVTAEDFEALAIGAPSARVRRARALPLFDPRYPGVDIPGAVTVIVVPDGDAPNPIPNEATLATVCAYLDGRRLLTTELHVVPPRYQRVKVTVAAVARPDGDPGQATQLIQLALAHYLHPLEGGEDGTGWEFGGTVYYSQLARRVLDVPGVDRILDGGLAIELDGVAQPLGRDVPVAANALVYTVLTDNVVTVERAWRPVQ